MEKAETIFIDQMPIAPIFHWSGTYMVQDYVKATKPESIGLGLFEDFYIDESLKL